VNILAKSMIPKNTKRRTCRMAQVMKLSDITLHLNAIEQHYF